MVGQRQEALFIMLMVVVWLQDGATVSVGGERTGKRGRPKGQRKVLRIGPLVARKVKGPKQSPRKRQRYERPLPVHPQTPPVPDTAIFANHCEAFHAALRRICAAFHRKMNHYAKTPEGVVRALAVQQVAHDWLRPKETGKATAAMKRGLTDRSWTFDDFLRWRYLPKSTIISESVVV